MDENIFLLKKAGNFEELSGYLILETKKNKDFIAKNFKYFNHAIFNSTNEYELEGVIFSMFYSGGIKSKKYERRLLEISDMDNIDVNVRNVSLRAISIIYEDKFEIEDIITELFLRLMMYEDFSLKTKCIIVIVEIFFKKDIADKIMNAFIENMDSWDDKEIYSFYVDYFKGELEGIINYFSLNYNVEKL